MLDSTVAPQPRALRIWLATCFNSFEVEPSVGNPLTTVTVLPARPFRSLRNTNCFREASWKLVVELVGAGGWGGELVSVKPLDWNASPRLEPSDELSARGRRFRFFTMFKVFVAGLRLLQMPSDRGRQA